MFLGWADLCLGIQDDHSVRIIQSFDRLAGSHFDLACKCTNVLAETSLRGRLLLWHSGYIHQNFLSNNVVEHRREQNYSFRSFWICVRISIDVNPWKYSTRTQLVLHQFQTILRTRWTVEISSPNTRVNRNRHVPLISPIWLFHMAQRSFSSTERRSLQSRYIRFSFHIPFMNSLRHGGRLVNWTKMAARKLQRFKMLTKQRRLKHSSRVKLFFAQQVSDLGFWCPHIWWGSWGPSWFCRTPTLTRLCGF